MAEHRYEREIDELLRNLESEHRAPLPFRRRRVSPWTAAWRRARLLLAVESAVERLMALAVILLLTTFLLGVFAPRLAGPLGLLAVLCFVGALTLSVVNGVSGHTNVDYLRGRSYPHAERGVDWAALSWHLRRWLRRLRG
jgi:hypothetical protein